MLRVPIISNPGACTPLLSDVCLKNLWDRCLGSATLDCTLLTSGNDTTLLQFVRDGGNCAYELSVVFGAKGGLRYQIRYGKACAEKRVWDARVTFSDDHGWSDAFVKGIPH